MRLDGREWRTLVSVVRLGGDSYRVIRPARPIAHASLHEGRLGAQLSVDKAATVDLAFASRNCTSSAATAIGEVSRSAGYQPHRDVGRASNGSGSASGAASRKLYAGRGPVNSTRTFRRPVTSARAVSTRSSGTR